MEKNVKKSEDDHGVDLLKHDADDDWEDNDDAGNCEGYIQETEGERDMVEEGEVSENGGLNDIHFVCWDDDVFQFSS